MVISEKGKTFDGFSLNEETSWKRSCYVEK